MVLRGVQIKKTPEIAHKIYLKEIYYFYLCPNDRRILINSLLITFQELSCGIWARVRKAMGI